MSVDLGHPALAAITLHERGGGIAALSRLVLDVLAEHSDGPVRSLSLIAGPREGTFATGTAARLAFGRRVAACEATGHCDWLFFTHLSLATVQRFVPALIRKPYAVFLHDIEAWNAQPDVRRHVLRGAFLRVANSAYTARRVAESNPTVGPVVSCPLALPADWSTPPPLPRPPGLPADARTVIIVGRMVSTERYKGHDQLIEAWPQVRAAVPDARLVCVGEGDDVARLRAKATAAGVGDAVAFPGFVSDAVRRALYQQAGVFAMPSRREGFGLVYLEAMASGMPCIGSIHDAAPEVIADGVTGVLVDQADIASLASHIVRLLTHDDLRRGMGEAGRRRFLSEFTYGAFARRLVAHVQRARRLHAATPTLDARATDF
jgi:phosphatidyl-myo-inositol dimannoside synthase